MAASCRNSLPIRAMVVVVPSFVSHQFRIFCELNKSLCPLLYQSAIGETTAGHLAQESDIRTALGSYVVLKNGYKISHVTDLRQFPWSDMVTFYIGCVNHCVQKLLWDVGIPVQGKGKSQHTPLYKTGLTSIKVGSFCSSVVVAMHLIPRDLLQKAIDVTTNFKDIHGMPIHIGDPSVIGVTDVNKPDYGDSPDIQDRVPVFWASSITAHLAVKSAGLELAFIDDMERLFDCETTNEDITGLLPEDTKSRVVTMKEKPFVASLLSESAFRKIRFLETEILEDMGKRGIEKLHIPNELVKAALVLSHAVSVGVHFGFPCNTGRKHPDETDGPAGFIAICKALNALGKKVTCIASSYQVNLVRELVAKFLSDKVAVLEFKPANMEDVGRAAEEFLFLDDAKQSSPKFDTLIAIEATARTEEGCYMTMKGRNLIDICKDSPVDELFIQAHKSGKIATIGIGDGGNEIGMGKVRHLVVDHIDLGPKIASSVSTDQLITAGVSNWGGSALAAALYILHHCPVHSRYTRQGAQKERDVAFEEVLNSLETEEKILSYLGEIGVCDGISQKKKMSVDNLPFDPVHKHMLQKLLTIAAPSSLSSGEHDFL
ncbi:D-glutamate cyclase, mitochondrial-like isoform X1 [Montipora capricornis]|uniref:D-glutamate cyclase, mitochondrial-like isoform X1 n=1 Tax=Montipora capricornis TaxID=246305 RepID=UPI0035F10DE7